MINSDKRTTKPICQLQGLVQDSWLKDYAIKSKKVKGFDDSQINTAKKSLDRAFRTIYRAVAFDIDGTLTNHGKVNIRPEMITIISDLIKKGVHIILVTGRGRTSTFEVANQIRKGIDLSSWYFRRLRCVTHNGLLVMSTPSSDPKNFLGEIQFIAKPIPNINNLYEDISKIGSLMQIGKEFKVTKEPSSEPHSIRIVFPNSVSVDNIESHISKILPKYSRNDIKLTQTHGTYGVKRSIDISTTTKKRALKEVAIQLGIKIDQILRIGDQGKIGGNDYDLLNNYCGFSVDEISSNPDTCHPVFENDFSKRLTGAEATERLLSQVMLFPPLSLEPPPIERRIKDLYAFERIAVIRAREEYNKTLKGMRDLLQKHFSIPLKKLPGANEPVA